MERKSKQEYKDIGEKLKTAEFKGMVVTKLKYIEKSIDGLHGIDKEHDERIKTLEEFNSNLAGKFTVIGAIIIIAANWIWDVGKTLVETFKNN